jgi:hypothetical protein
MRAAVPEEGGCPRTPHIAANASSKAQTRGSLRQPAGVEHAEDGPLFLADKRLRDGDFFIWPAVRASQRRQAERPHSGQSQLSLVAGCNGCPHRRRSGRPLAGCP